MATRYSWFLTSLGTPIFTGHTPPARARLRAGGPSPTIATGDAGHVLGPSSRPGDRLGGTQRAQHVPAGPLREVLVRPATFRKSGEQPGIAGDVLETLGEPVDPVVVASEADVV